MWDFMTRKLTLFNCLFWICWLFLGKRLNWLQQLLKFHKADEWSLQLTPEESLYKLSRHITLFLIRHLTIIYFDFNVFLKHFNSLSTGVDLCSIHRFIQRVQFTNFNVYEDGNRKQKESTFQICNKEHGIFLMWIYNSFSINLSDLF